MTNKEIAQRLILAIGYGATFAAGMLLAVHAALSIDWS